MPDDFFRRVVDLAHARRGRGLFHRALVAYDLVHRWHFTWREAWRYSK